LLDGTLDQAARVAVQGKAQAIDLGVAGGRVFLNNASIGAYARMVRRRDAMGLPKWLATLPASLAVLLRPNAQRMRIEVDGDHRSLRSPLLFIGNNRYSLDAGHIGERASLSDGTLSIYAVADKSALGLLSTAWRILRGKADPQSDFAALADCSEVTAWRRGRHHIALDGEVVEMRFPLRFGIMPQALEVMMPG
jgi:diacylglycerol kinase family enzyme